MSTDVFLALLGFALATSITPGPNNMMLLASGVNFGFRRTIPHMAGIGFGFLVLLLAVGFGLGAEQAAGPRLHLLLKIAGGLYLLYMAARLAGVSRLSAAAPPPRPMSFVEAALFQWVNPKAWVMSVSAMATFTMEGDHAGAVLFVGIVFALVNVPSVSVWAGFGAALSDWLSVPSRLRAFNITMAVLLVASLWPMLR